MSEHTTIFDIAREAGVSIATVSRVISGGAPVRAETRERVLAVVAKYNFRPSLVATGLSRKKTHTLGIIIPLIENPFYSKMCVALQLEAERLTHSTLLFQVPRGTMLTQDFMDQLIARRLDGVIFSGDVTDDASSDAAVEGMLQLRRQMPLVAINLREACHGLPCLMLGLASCSALAIRHLRKLGHRRIALIGGVGSAQLTNTREQGYLDEMEKLGEAPYPMTVGESAPEGEACVTSLLAQLGGRARPTALMAFNDLVALGALRQLKRIGIRVPEDIALVGCDNQFFAPYADPPLTTLDLHIEETSRLAMSLLVSAQTANLDGFEQHFEPTLIVRESCGFLLNDRPPA
jgi:DNA-binding LacI/PurR family transcriptional regulator